MTGLLNCLVTSKCATDTVSHTARTDDLQQANDLAVKLKKAEVALMLLNSTVIETISFLAVFLLPSLMLLPLVIIVQTVLLPLLRLY